MSVWRRGAQRNLNIAVGEMTPERASAEPAAPEPPLASSGPSNWLGLVASALGDERRQQLRVKSGVLVEINCESDFAEYVISKPAIVKYFWVERFTNVNDIVY